MANKRIKDLTEKSSFVSGDYFPIDNSNGTKKVNASKIMTPLSSAQTDATRALNMIRSTSSFPTGDAYSSSSSYKVGDMVIYNNTLYRCKTACSAASWSVNANNFEAISLASALTDLNNDLHPELDFANASTKTVNTANATFTDDGYFIFNNFYISAHSGAFPYFNFYINDVSLGTLNVSADNTRVSSIVIPVKKGMTYRYSLSAGTIGQHTGLFIPYK